MSFRVENRIVPRVGQFWVDIVSRLLKLSRANRKQANLSNNQPKLSVLQGNLNAIYGNQNTIWAQIKVQLEVQQLLQGSGFQHL